MESGRIDLPEFAKIAGGPNAEDPEGKVDYIRASHEPRHALVISDAQPVASLQSIWASMGQAANIGIFLILFGGVLYVDSLSDARGAVPTYLKLLEVTVDTIAKGFGQ